MDVTRRGFLVSGLVGGVGGAALLSGAASGRRVVAGPEPEDGGDGYVTLPGVRRPGLKARRLGSTASGLLFLAPFRGKDAADALIVDDDGEPVWIYRSDRLVTDVRVQAYEGEPVLTYWEGDRKVGGYGHGVGVVLGRDYRRVAEVRAGRGIPGDLHEFALTARGTALIIAYPEVAADLRPVGGPRKGRVLDGRVQEIDVKTGEVLLDWSALDHVGIEETRITPGGSEGAAVFDPIHINSVQDDGDTLLLSARNTCALYSLDRRTGAVRWRLGGRRSDFTFGPHAEFAWQHDARRLPDGTVTLFDNHIEEVGDGPSRGVVLEVDEAARHVSLVREVSDGATYGQYMGNMQVLPDGSALVGWGSTPTVTEFAADGTPVLEITGIGDGSYRAYRAAWSGRPVARPAVAVSSADSRWMRVHASWNGATDVAAWRFLAGSVPSRPAVAATVRRAGFETAVTLPRSPNVVAEALARDGTPIGRSALARGSVV
ncbi:ArsR family transcriptional regulator [Actinomadura sp. KC216]|uniref:arylsulfotransferase family protein n=1 Tax=Actinomadura sp. KC216 TaxID=2530370 RepID=UPI001052D86F|nr:arylsulfotransferase family protein [Actinomadura sp. KC216]TDB83355.1 ArsR family transcriptional regulator [Actinomadura sp. KC216]